MKFIGDLSEADAELLIRYGEEAEVILEFGAGGSTQIFAQCRPEIFVSVETEPMWVRKTCANLEKFDNLITWPTFAKYGEHSEQKYDLIFVDGVWDKRLDFALKTWPLLASYGHMIFHDTRRWFDAENAFKVCAMAHNEIDYVSVNENNSNCTVIKKRKKIEYENWNETEGKPAWAYGNGEPPDGWEKL